MPEEKPAPCKICGMPSDTICGQCGKAVCYDCMIAGKCQDCASWKTVEP